MRKTSPTATSARARFGPAAALCIYALLLGGGVYTIVSALGDLQARREAVEAAAAQAARLAARGAPTQPADAAPDDVPPGSAFLGGDKLTVASAEFQRRVTAAVARAGGAVLSSQVEKQEPKGLATGVELTVECDIDQNGLQRLLYELESKPPFLFVEAMNIRARGETRNAEADQRLRASLRLASAWRNQEP